MVLDVGLGFCFLGAVWLGCVREGREGVYCCVCIRVRAGDALFIGYYLGLRFGRVC